MTGFRFVSRFVSNGAGAVLIAAMGIVLALRTPWVAAAVIMVNPADATASHTIQAGIDRAADGDVVLVSPGIYEERVRLDKRRGITLRGLAAVVSGTGPSGSGLSGSGLSGSGLSGSGGGGLGLPVVARGIEIGPSASAITVEGFVVRDAAWGVLIAAERPGGMPGTPPSGADRGITIRYNTFYRVGVGVAACSHATLEANLFVTDLHDVFDCGVRSELIVRHNRLSEALERPRALLRRIDTRFTATGNLLGPPEFRDAVGGDLRLRPGSRFRRAGPDGREIGAYGLPALRPVPEVVLPLPPFRLPWPAPLAGASR